MTQNSKRTNLDSNSIVNIKKPPDTGNAQEDFENFEKLVKKTYFDLPLNNYYAYIAGKDKIGRNIFTIARFPKSTRYNSYQIMVYLATRMGNLVCD